MKILLRFFLGICMATVSLNAMQNNNIIEEGHEHSYILIIGNNGEKGGVLFSASTKLHEKRGLKLTFEHPQIINGHKVITIDTLPNKKKNHIQKNFLQCDFPGSFGAFSNPKMSSVGRIYFEMIPPSVFPALIYKAQSVLKKNQRFDASFFPAVAGIQDPNAHFYNRENPLLHILSLDYMEYFFSFVNKKNIEIAIKKREKCIEEKSIWPSLQIKKDKYSNNDLARELARNFFKALVFYINQTDTSHDQLSKQIMKDVSILKNKWELSNKDLHSTSYFFQNDYLINSLFCWSHVFFLKDTAFFLFEDFMSKNNFKDFSISFRNDPYTGRNLIPFISAYKK